MTSQPHLLLPSSSWHGAKINSGLASARPTAPDIAVGELYYETDTEYVRFSPDGTNWYYLVPANHNFAATAAPTANDDIGDGYAPGSMWLDVTNAKVYTCKIATLANAVWIELTATGAGGGVSVEGCAAYRSGTLTCTPGSTNVLFTAETYDDNAMHSTASNQQRFTAQHTGHITISAYAWMVANTEASGICQLRISKNSGASTFFLSNHLLNSTDFLMTGMIQDKCTLNDTYDVIIYHTGAGNITAGAASYGDTRAEMTVLY